MNLEVDRFLEDMEGRYAGHFRDAIGGLVVAMARGNRFAILDATTVLRRLIGETMGVGEILGASLVLQRAAELADGGPVMFRDSTQPLLPSVTFSESVDDMVKRAPVTLRGAARRTARRISEVYSRGGMVAFAKSAEQTVTAKVQEVIVQAMREGLGEGEAGRLIRESVDLIRERTAPWTDSYARTVFRNNVNTSVTAGRFRQAMDPDVRAVIPCFRFDAVGDADTRHNHEAANGLIFKTTNPVWQKIAPPLGHNCRCQVSLVTLPELRRMGRISADGTIQEDTLPPDAFPDEGFRRTGRMDLLGVGAA